MVIALLLASLGASPVTFSRCEREVLDQPLLVGLLDDATRAQPIEVVCLRPDVVRVKRGSVSRELELPTGAASLRARTVAFVLGELAAGRVMSAPPPRPSPPRPREPGPPLVEARPLLDGAGADAGAPSAAPALVQAEPLLPDAGVRVPSAAPSEPLSAPALVQAEPPLLSVGVDAGVRLPSAAPSEPLTAPALVEAAPLPLDAGVVAPDAGVLAQPTWSGSPVELAVVPPLDVNELVGRPARNVFALGLLATRSTWLDGLGLAPVSLVDEDTRGVQLGALAAWTHASLTGLQLSAAVSWTSGALLGVQLSPVSLAGSLEGAQLGVLNLTSDVTGFQLGVLNVGRVVQGAQLGVVNVATGPGARLHGLHLGAVNVSGDVDGAQLGLLNVGRVVRGVQLGLVNVAHASTVPIGLINLIDEQPMRVVLRVGTSALVQTALRLGGEYLYSFLTVGWTPRSTLRWGGGVGTHLGRGPGWFLEFELGGASAWTLEVVNSWANQVAVSAEAHVGYQVAPRFAIFASLGTELVFAPPGVGPTLNLIGLPLSATTTLSPTAFLGVIF